MGRRQISEAVQAHLRGFTERNRERAAKRRQQLATSLSGDLPVKRPWFDAVRVVNPTFETPRTHHTHVEIREALAK